MTASLAQSSAKEAHHPRGARPARIESIDALRAAVMFVMIVVNDIGGLPQVPAWMKHYRGYSGMTFVDLVFPAFLFVVGMSIPLALGPRLGRGEPVWKILAHVLVRTIALLAIGIMMVNSDLNPSSAKMGISATTWTVLMYVSAILGFCSISPGRNAPEDRRRFWKGVTIALRTAGLGLMLFLALAFRAENGRHLLQFNPFFIRHAWYGILGIIGWAYLVASIVYLLFRNHRTALLAATALVMCLYATSDLFANLWIAHHVNIPSALGSHAAISVAGVLLGSILLTSDTATPPSRIRFTLLFIAGCAIAAILLTPQWGVSKERGTPAWCFWACAITAALWLVLYLIDEPLGGRAALKPIAIAGRNVLLAYLLSEMLDSTLQLVHLSAWYERLAEPDFAHALVRSTVCATVIMAVAVLTNRIGFSLKL